MKNLLLAILMCVGTCLSAQHLSPVSIEDKKMDAYISKRQPPVLAVQIKNLSDSVKKVSIKYTLVQLGTGFQSEKYSETDASGSAKLILDQNLPYQQIWLRAGDYLYAGVYVNEGLTVIIDVQKTPEKGAYMIGDGITYSGPDGKLNTVMNKETVFKQDERNDLFSNLSALCQAKAKYTPAAFQYKIDSIRKQLTKIDDEFITGYPNYAWAVNNETLSDYYGALCISYCNSEMPAKLYDEISRHQPYFTSNSGSLYYRYLLYYVRSNPGFKTGNGLTSNMRLFDSLYTQQRSDVLKLYLLDEEKDNFARSYPVIIDGIKTTWCKKIAVDELAKANASKKRIDSLFATATKLDNADLATPLVKLPFDASLYQLDSVNNIDDFIVQLKSKFPKKALIIDFWATWCAPCLGDLPFSKKLHEGNKDLPIEYVYLCTSQGSTIDIWKSKIANMQIPGTHLYVNDKIIARLKTAFNAEGGFPAYVVIDIDGKINPKAISWMQSLTRESIKKIAGL